MAAKKVSCRASATGVVGEIESKFAREKKKS